MGLRRLRGAAVALVCALALSSCGSGHPGQAAVVAGEPISDERLQRGTDGFCELIDVINATQGTNAPIPVRTAVLSTLNTLVIGTALDQIAERRGVDVSAAEVRQWIEQLPVDLSRVPQPRADELRSITERVARNSLLVEKVGLAAYQERNPGDAGAPPGQIRQLGQQLVSDYLERVEVETNPRYGQVLDTQRRPGTGSLSVPVSQEAIESQTIPEASNSLSQRQQCP